MRRVHDFYTTGDVSKMLGISERTIRNYCNSGKLVCVQTPVTKYRRIHRESLMAFMDENGLSMEHFDNISEKKVLIVEDDEYMLEFISLIVFDAFSNVTIETAIDGYEACIKVGAFVPDIVILDLNLPKADGFEVCKSIRSVACTRNAEIIVVSGYLNEEKRKRLEEYSIRYIFEKPLHEEELIKTMKLFCEVKNSVTHEY